MSKRKATPKTPYWLTTPCPAWCGSIHTTSDGGPDRAHFSKWERHRKLTQHDATVHQASEGFSRYVDIPTLQVSLQQGDRVIAPLVIVETEGEPGTGGLHLTVAEAEWLLKSLARAVALAEQ